MIAAAPLSAPLPKGDVGAPDGDWLWAQLMDWCKSRNVPPGNYDDLFAIVGRARQHHIKGGSYERRHFGLRAVPLSS